MSNLISTHWLQENVAAPDLLILDASWHLPTAKRDAKAEFNAAHIAGAQFFDLDAISDTTSNLPHMLPTPEKFAAAMGKLGATNSKRVICYDTTGLFSAARCWWMFKIFGHDNVAVLDGGLPKWLRENRPTQSGVPASVVSTNFLTIFNSQMVKSRAEVATEQSQIADARSPTRFRGEEPEPRAGVRPGHIPGAFNVHYSSLLNEDGSLKSNADLGQAFKNAGINIQNPIVTSCGSGVTAAILSLALTELGALSHALYDGSWADWGSSDLPVALG